MSKIRQIQSLGHKHFSKKGREFHLFDVTECEVCGEELADVNAVNVSGVTRETLIKAGLTERDVPFDEGGYSEIHECLTCSDCNK